MRILCAGAQGAPDRIRIWASSPARPARHSVANGDPARLERKRLEGASWGLFF